MVQVYCLPNKFFCANRLMISFDFHRLGAFFVRNYRVSHHARPPLRAASWILNLKTLAQRFQVCYAQKYMGEI